MNTNEASKILSLISDPNRLVVVTLLVKNRKMSANEFLSFTTCKQATLSHHLNEMVDAELLKCKKKGNKVFYSLNSSKYGQLLNFLGKVNNAASVEEEKKEEKPVEVAPQPEPQPEPVVEEKKEVVRVADSDLVRPTPVKVELPYWLL